MSRRGFSVRRELAERYKDVLAITIGQKFPTSFFNHAHKSWKRENRQSAWEMQQEFQKNGSKGRVLIVRAKGGRSKLCTLYTPDKKDYTDIIVAPNPHLGYYFPAIVNNEDDLVKVINELIIARLEAIGPEVESLQRGMDEIEETCPNTGTLLTTL